jgi:RNA polymerase sigma-70 factor, ECF subfamily
VGRAKLAGFHSYPIETAETARLKWQFLCYSHDMFAGPSGSPGAWAEVVRKIRAGDAAGIEDLYRALSDGVRASLIELVGAQSAEDWLHEILIVVLEAVRGGQLREPDRLMGFVRTVAKRSVVAHIRNATAQRRRFVPEAEVQAPSKQSPDAGIAERERIEKIRNVLRSLSARDREILERFYFKEQAAEQICGEMRLTVTQFRLYKSRAIAKCFNLAQPARKARRATR